VLCDVHLHSRVFWIATHAAMVRALHKQPAGKSAVGFIFASSVPVHRALLAAAFNGAFAVSYRGIRWELRHARKVAVLWQRARCAQNEKSRMPAVTGMRLEW
jgi:hypothetical protein